MPILWSSPSLSVCLPYTRFIPSSIRSHSSSIPSNVPSKFSPSLLLPIFPFQSMVSVMARSFNDSFPLARRLSILLSSIPHFIITMVIASSAYIWSIGGKEFDRYLILPLALLLFSLGFWEAWITPNHAGSYFHHLYQVSCYIILF